MSSQNLNRVTVTGNLTADPALRHLANATALVRLRVAVNERRKDPETGEWGSRPSYFDVTVWGASAEACARFLKCGSKVAVDGRLQWREWTTDDGPKRQAVEIVAEHVEFLTPRTEPGERPLAATTTATNVDHDQEIPF